MKQNWFSDLSCLLAWLAAVLAGCVHAERVQFGPAPGAVTIRHPALYPETIVYNPQHGSFLVGSFREGAVFEVNAAGDATLLVRDPRLHSVLGIAVDAPRNRLWALNADLGASLRPSSSGPKTVAAVGIYDLSTGAAQAYVDLAPLSAGAHLANGIALDASGDAYVTDSFAPVIYKVANDGQASVFVRDARLAGDGISLNGVVVHPDGYLLVVKKSDGSLFKIPLAQPQGLRQVALPRPLVGGDGLLLTGARSLLVIANQTPAAASNAAFVLSSADGWISAQLDGVQPLGNVYPTTAALRDGRIFVLHSQLNELIQAPRDQQSSLRTEATIREIGRVQ